MTQKNKVIDKQIQLGMNCRKLFSHLLPYQAVSPIQHTKEENSFFQITTHKSDTFVKKSNTKRGL